jgi:hypothetical protein
LSGKPLDLSKLTHLAGWVDPTHQLKGRSLKQLTETLVERTCCPPSFTNKLDHFRGTWDSFLAWRKLPPIPAPSCIPILWKLTIPTPLKETIWKWSLDALPIGHRFRSKSDLGRHCCCGAELTLPHLWKSCPAYNLTPLLAIADSHVKQASTPEMEQTGHPGLIQPLGADSLYWLPLLTIPYLEKN